MEIKITLSRAHKVAERLKGLLAEQSAIACQNLSDVSITLSSGGSQYPALVARTAAGLAAVTAYNRFNKVLGELRGFVGKVNAAAGVSDLLTQQETLSRQLGFLKSLLEQSTGDVNAIQPSQLEFYKPLVVDRPLREPSVMVSLLPETHRKELEMAVAEAKKALFIVSDKVADANATKVAITLDEDMAELLGLQS